MEILVLEKDFPKTSICIEYHRGVVMGALLIIHGSSYIQKSSREGKEKLCVNQRKKIRRFL